MELADEQRKGPFADLTSEGPCWSAVSDLVSLSEDADGTHAAAGVHAKVVG